MNVLKCLVWNFHHSCCKFKSWNWFFNVVRLRPNVCNH